MLTVVQIRRRKLYGALAAIAGVLLIGFGVAGLTGNLGGTSAKSKVTSAGTVPARSASPSAQSSGPAASVSNSSATKSATSKSSSPSSAAAAVKLPVTVLNAGGASGLAGRIRDALQTKGWTVAEVGNLTTAPVSVSTIYYPADNSDAQAAAAALKSDFPKLTQVAQTPSSLKYDGLVIVATGDWDPQSS
ncbi:MAG: LytR C-terminal domain-containing protein [Antricoccus sp.]